MDLFDELKASTLGGIKSKPSSDNCDRSTNLAFFNKYDEIKAKKHSLRPEEEKSAQFTKKNSEKKLEHVGKYKNDEQSLAKFNEKHKSHYSGIRRESMPSPETHGFVSKAKKCRSLSPPKYGGNAFIKSFKVKIERKNLGDFIRSPIAAKANSVKSKPEKHKDANDPSKKSPMKATPTKAQQKLFEPIGNKKSKVKTIKGFNVKKCEVRIRRDNLKKLMREYKKSKASNKAPSKQSGAKTLGRPRKRLNPSDDDGSSPTKNRKISPNKAKSSFFIKISPHKVEKKPRSHPRASSSSSVAQHNKIRNSKPMGITTPTKFSRSHLIRTFGKRFFSSFVRIEKCHHPLLLTFESNDRARRLKAKRNKSKNLSVTFKEHVEVFGNSSDSDNYDESFCADLPQKGGRRSLNVSLALASATPVVMPARLKKVENGKVVDDIELDPSLFMDPKNLISSTPYTQGRKKRDHKSFSPLKDEGGPSPRKEQLKLANEKIPPSGLRRINIDDDDDEDDDCEYIVPIELPQRRTSHTSSTNNLDVGPTMLPPAPKELNVAVSCPNPQDKNIEIESDKTKKNMEIESDKTKKNIETESDKTNKNIVIEADKSNKIMEIESGTSNKNTEIESNKSVAPNEADTLATESIPPQNVDSAPTPTVSTSSPEKMNTSPIPNSDITESAEPEADPELNVALEIPVSGSDVEPEKVQSQPNSSTEEIESHDSFHSANDLGHQQVVDDNNSTKKNRLTSLSPSSALNNVLESVELPAVDSPSALASEPQQTQDVAELNGTGVSIHDTTLNLFMEDDSHTDGDEPEKSFVDSIINETIDKLSKEIEEGGPVDEKLAHLT